MQLSFTTQRHLTHKVQTKCIFRSRLDSQSTDQMQFCSRLDRQRRTTYIRKSKQMYDVLYDGYEYTRIHRISSATCSDHFPHANNKRLFSLASPYGNSKNTGPRGLVGWVTTVDRLGSTYISHHHEERPSNLQPTGGEYATSLGRLTQQQGQAFRQKQNSSCTQ